MKWEVEEKKQKYAEEMREAERAKENAKKKLNYQRPSLFYTISIGKLTSHSNLCFGLIRKGQTDLSIMS